MKLNSAPLSFLWLIGGLGLFARGAMVPHSGTTAALFVGACMCWLVSLWLTLRRWRGRGPQRGSVLQILIACLAVLLVFGSLLYAGWRNAHKLRGEAAVEKKAEN